MDSVGARNATAIRSNPDSRHHAGTTLTDAAMMWPSARAEDSESSGRRESRGVSDTLTAAARDFDPLWPLPMADAAGNSDFSRRAMELSDEMLTWAAPRTSDTNGPGLHGDGGVDLLTQAATWESPGVALTEGSRKTRSGARSDELLLTGQAEATTEHWNPANWPAPATRDHKGSSEGSIFRQDGKSRSDMLDFAAEQFFSLPPSSPAQPTAAGAMSSTATPNSNPPSARRKLNPIFVEALMRWPTGLSGFERQETAWTRWWQLMPSFVSALCSTPSAPAQASLFG